MAGKTFLQAINEVHGFLRRDEDGTGVTAITQDADTVIVAKMINEAKRRVEGRWKWHMMRVGITFSSVGGTGTYDTSNVAIAATQQTNDRSEVLLDNKGNALFWDITTTGAGVRVAVIPRDVALQQFYTNSNVQQPIPDYAAVYRVGDGLTVFFPTSPSGVRNYSMWVYRPQAELTSASTEILAPWRPIVLLATALAAEERGESFGVPPARYLDLYEAAYEEEEAFDKSEDYDNMLEPV